MTDEELIARLRDAVSGEHDMTPHGADVLQAADRIEALTKERDEAVHLARMRKTFTEEARDERDAAEAKLAKAVEALGRAKASIESGGGGGVVDVVWLDDPCPETLCDFIDATLAEIKGESHE